MKPKQDKIANGDANIGKCSASLQKLANFCCSYNAGEIDELLSRLLIAVIGGGYYRMNNLSKERLLNYFEALEEVLPAVHEINSHIATLTESEDDETYEQKIAYRRLFASLKRHPE